METSNLTYFEIVLIFTSGLFFVAIAVKIFNGSTKREDQDDNYSSILSENSNQFKLED